MRVPLCANPTFLLTASSTCAWNRNFSPNSQPSITKQSTRLACEGTAQNVGSEMLPEISQPRGHPSLEEECKWKEPPSGNLGFQWGRKTTTTGTKGGGRTNEQHRPFHVCRSLSRPTLIRFAWGCFLDNAQVMIPLPLLPGLECISIWAYSLLGDIWCLGCKFGQFFKIPPPLLCRMDTRSSGWSDMVMENEPPHAPITPNFLSGSGREIIGDYVEK